MHVSACLTGSCFKSKYSTSITENGVADCCEILYKHKLPHHDKSAFNPTIINTNTVAVESPEGETILQQNRCNQ
jgi:hypothetical protein